MVCNCMGGNPCPCQRQGLQWPFYVPFPSYFGPPRPGWVCSKCQASINPDVQQCPSCMPPVTSLSGATVNVDELLKNEPK